MPVEDSYIPATPSSVCLRKSGKIPLIVTEGDDLELDSKDEIPYVLVKNLGHGASATVEMVQDVTNGRTYARKIFKNVYARNLEESKKLFRNELRVMRQLKSHHHMIQVYATYIAQRELALILTPVADAGDLAAFLQLYRDTNPMDPEREDMKAILWKAYGCLASGLAFIHQTIRHKDIKPQNILIHQGIVLFTDFGISFDFSEGRSTTTGHPNSFTRRYCAPEVADWDKRNSKSDVFSLGCVYAEILDALQPGCLPEALLNGPFHVTLDQLSPTKSPSISFQESKFYHILRLLKGMLKAVAWQRMSASDVTEFLADYLDDEQVFCTKCNPIREIGVSYTESLDGELDMDVPISTLDEFEESEWPYGTGGMPFTLRRFLSHEYSPERSFRRSSREGRMELNSSFTDEMDTVEEEDEKWFERGDERDANDKSEEGDQKHAQQDRRRRAKARILERANGPRKDTGSPTSIDVYDLEEATKGLLQPEDEISQHDETDTDNEEDTSSIWSVVGSNAIVSSNNGPRTGAFSTPTLATAGLFSKDLEDLDKERTRTRARGLRSSLNEYNPRIKEMFAAHKRALSSTKEPDLTLGETEDWVKQFMGRSSLRSTSELDLNAEERSVPSTNPFRRRKTAPDPSRQLQQAKTQNPFRK